MTGADEISALQALLSRATAASAWMKAHPRVLAALGAFLGVLATGKVAWAIDLQTLLNDAPGALAMATSDLPKAIFLLQEIQPAATGIEGENANDPNIKDR